MWTKSSSAERRTEVRRAVRFALRTAGAGALLMGLFWALAPKPETAVSIKLAHAGAPSNDASVADRSTAPRWADTPPARERIVASPDLFRQTARRSPADAVALAREWSHQDPARAGDYGQWLIDALAEVGAFGPAVEFLRHEASPHRAAWLEDVFTIWGAEDPVKALQQAAAFERAEDSQSARDAALSGWAAVDPEQVARFAVAIPETDARQRALDEALPKWVGRDAAGAAAWLAQFDPVPELDAGVEALASRSLRVGEDAGVGLVWAASIADPTLRSNTLQAIATEVAMRDATDVRRFVEKTPALSDSDRRTLRDAIASANTP